MNHRPAAAGPWPNAAGPSDLLLILAVIFPAAGLLSLLASEEPVLLLVTGLMVVVATLLEVGRLKAARIIPTLARYFGCAALAGATCTVPASSFRSRGFTFTELLRCACNPGTPRALDGPRAVRLSLNVAVGG